MTVFAVTLMAEERRFVKTVAGGCARRRHCLHRYGRDRYCGGVDRDGELARAISKCALCDLAGRQRSQASGGLLDLRPRPRYMAQSASNLQPRLHFSGHLYAEGRQRMLATMVALGLVVMALLSSVLHCLCGLGGIGTGLRGELAQARGFVLAIGPERTCVGAARRPWSDDRAVVRRGCPRGPV